MVSIFFVHPSSEADIPYWNIFLDTGRNFARCLPDDFVVLYLGDIVTPGQFRGHTLRGNFRRESGDIPSFEVFVLNAFEKGFETDIAFGVSRQTARSARPEINVLFRTDC